MGSTDPVPKGTMNARRTAATVSVLVLTLGLAACGEDEPATGAPEPTTSATAESPAATPTEEPEDTPSAEPEDDRIVLEAQIRDGRIEPNAQRVKVPLGEEITLVITSDTTGELHVHSRPEQYIDLEPGKTTARITIEAPGLIEVEEHDTGILIWSLQVS